MVLLSASICTKTGKAVVARQFMEMSRPRVEGLLAAFPKLINHDEQHTFIETDAVRYVYQPLDSLYMVLITTKNSNILEDLETLRLFAKVIPEYCRTMSEEEVQSRAFDLIAAFDEIVALGYRENVNLAQIRTFTEMDSHDENVYKMVQKNKEREAKEHMKRKAKELTLSRREQMRTGGGGGGSGGFAGGFGSNARGSSQFGGIGSHSSPMESGQSTISKPAASTSAAAPAAKTKKPGRGMKLGGKAKTNEFVEALIAEGEQVTDVSDPKPVAQTSSSSSSRPEPVASNRKSVHITVEEKITLTANRDGGLENMEVKGIMQLSVTDPEIARLRVNVGKGSVRNIPFQTHPNVDKKLFAAESVVALKNQGKPFPVNSEVGVVKWRYQASSDDEIPLTINCWPNPGANGSCDVNIEYELQSTDLTLQDVVISIPVPSGVGSPNIATCDGDYNYDSRNSVLEWSIPLIDESNADGAMEFSINAHDADEFFPVIVSFTSPKTFAGVEILDVVSCDGNESIDFSSDVLFCEERYEIV